MNKKAPDLQKALVKKRYEDLLRHSLFLTDGNQDDAKDLFMKVY